MSEKDNMEKILASAKKRPSHHMYLQSKAIGGQKINKFKVAANSFINFKRLGLSNGIEDDLMQPSIDAQSATQSSFDNRN